MKERSVLTVVTGQPTSDGAGVRLTRIIGTPALEQLDPFLLLDEFSQCWLGPLRGRRRLDAGAHGATLDRAGRARRSRAEPARPLPGGAQRGPAPARRPHAGPHARP